jgi:CRP/FNR family transcriptional regulator
LRRAPLFATLSQAELSALVKDFRPREFAKDDVIFRQGDEGRDLYVVVRGKIRIFKLSPGGNETSINIFSSGDVFGEFASLDGEPRSATAVALGRSTVWQMSAEAFLGHFRSTPDLALQVARLLSQKLRWTAAYAEAIAQYDAAGRLLHILLLYNEQFGEALEAGKRYVLDLSLNQTDLASLVGARREWVNRLLREWERRDLLRYEDGRLTIFDLPRLREERDRRIEADV